MDTRIDTAHDEGTNHAVEAGPLSGRFGSVSRRMACALLATSGSELSWKIKFMIGYKR